jgi:hypothetical protein
LILLLWETHLGTAIALAMEIAQLKAAGYVKVDDYYVPAEKAATFNP